MKQIGFDTGPDAFYDDGVLTDPRPPQMRPEQAPDAISWPGFGIITISNIAFKHKYW
jgi:hypothetical protein